MNQTINMLNVTGIKSNSPATTGAFLRFCLVARSVKQTIVIISTDKTGSFAENKQN